MKNYIYKTWKISRIQSVGVFFILLQSFLFSATFYADCLNPVADDSGPCSEIAPCETIQGAIDKTSDEDIVIVSVGIYYENLIIETGITLESADSDNPPTIDGSSATGDLGSCINIREDASGTSRGTVEVEGMILTGGRGTRVKIQNLNPSEDSDYDDPGESMIVGGGIRSQNVNLVSKKNKMVNNGTSASIIDEGGGTYLGDAPDIDQNDPRTPTSKNDNHSREDIIIRFEETEFSGNQAAFGGAGVFAGNSSDSTNLSLNFDHVTVADNYGGGIYATHYFNDDAITVTNSILWGNYPSSFGVYSEGQGPYINFTYNDIDMPIEGQGNINYDPRFVNPQEGDFTLRESSPCIDAGDPNSGHDPDGSPPDMGAYYFDQGGTSVCEDCYYDYNTYNGSECCDTAWEVYGINCADLEANYFWDCSGCNCPGDSVVECGDGTCHHQEDCVSCPIDCGECSGCDGIIGDATEDGILNVLDVVSIVNCLFDGYCNSCMDLNEDGILNVLDVVQLINIILGS